MDLIMKEIEVMLDLELIIKKSSSLILLFIFANIQFGCFSQSRDSCIEKLKEAPNTFYLGKGYIIPFIKICNDSCYNYEILFVPENVITKPIIDSLIFYSTIENKDKLLREFYFIDFQYENYLTKLYPFSWVVAQMGYSKEYPEEIKKMMDKFDKTQNSIIYSEAFQFSTGLEVDKEKYIIYKLLFIKGLFTLRPLDTKYQDCYFNYYYSITNYFKNGKSIIMAFDNQKMPIFCNLNYNVLSSVFANFEVGEFVSKKKRKKAINWGR